jgi:hypothetical protein
MLTNGIRRTIVIAVLASLPALATAAGSQAGDNGRQPVGADSDSPRQAVPNAVNNDGTLYDYNGRAYYASPYGPTYYEGPYYAPRYYSGYYPQYYDVSPPYYVPRTYYTPPSIYAPPAYYYTPPSSYEPQSYYAPPYYYGPTYYDSQTGYSLLSCDREPLALRASCRDAVLAREAR